MPDTSVVEHALLCLALSWREATFVGPSFAITDPLVGLLADDGPKDLLFWIHLAKVVRLWHWLLAAEAGGDGRYAEARREHTEQWRAAESLVGRLWGLLLWVGKVLVSSVNGDCGGVLCSSIVDVLR